MNLTNEPSGPAVREKIGRYLQASRICLAVIFEELALALGTEPSPVASEDLKALWDEIAESKPHADTLPAFVEAVQTFSDADKTRQASSQLPTILASLQAIGSMAGSGTDLDSCKSVSVDDADAVLNSVFNSENVNSPWLKLVQDRSTP